MAQAVWEVAHSADIDDPLVQSELVNLLSHRDPEIRHAALGALAYHGLAFDWSTSLGRRLLAGIDVLLKFDKDEDCRRGAASALGTLFRSTKNPAVIRALAKICENEGEADDVRAFAYDSMLTVLGVPVKNRPNPVDLTLGLDELEHVERIVNELPESDCER